MIFVRLTNALSGSGAYQMLSGAFSLQVKH